MKYNNKKRINASFVEQHDFSDCGVACLLMMIKYYNGDSSIMHLREISGTSSTGTTLLGLCQAAKTMGFDAFGAVVDSVDELKKLDAPCILSVVKEKVLSHYVTLFSYKDGNFLIGDPAEGVKTVSEQELEEIWTKKCLILTPNLSFEKKTSILQRKTEWIKNLVRDDYGLFSVSLIIGIITTLLGLAMTIFSQKLIDSILVNKELVKLIIGLSSILVINLIMVMLGSFRGKLLLEQSRGFNNRITKFFLRKLLRLPKYFYDTRKVGEILSRLGDTRRLQSIISTLVNSTTISALTVLIYSIFLFHYSWKIGLLVICFSPLFFWVIIKRNKKILQQQRSTMSAYAASESSLINTVNGITDIKSYSKEGRFLDNNYSLFSNFQDQAYSLGRTNVKIGVETGLSNSFFQILLLSLCSYFVFKDALTVGVMMAMVSMSTNILSEMSKIASAIIPINEAKVAFQRMFEFVDTQDEQEADDTEKKVTDVAADKIEIDDLSFRFTGRKRLLNDVSLSFEKGTITSIIGESGCGKSSLCQIIENFYKPESGKIMVDGVDLSDIDSDSWHNVVSYVPQDVFLYNGTILDNICFGEKLENPQEIFEFCDKYGFTKYFNELPAGVFTLVGEEGINLSGGQKQLVALARALYRNHKVIILDEITSAMDRRTESFVCDLLKELKKDNIIIFVTHRLETARLLSDNIVVLENGSVSVQGAHKELMKSDNFYSQYWNRLSDDE